MSDGPPLLLLDQVRYRWPGEQGFSLSVPELSISAGETVMILGDSGSGKSTLLSLICGTVTAQSGQVIIGGVDLASLPGGLRDRFRAEHIGMIFQQFNLLPFGSVKDNILLPLSFAPGRRARVETPQEEAARLCQVLGLPSELMSSKASALSVGQQQRVAVARALIGRPPIIVADEPTSALDAGSQSAFLDLLFAQVRANHSTLLMVSHDQRLSDRFDRVLHMDDFSDRARGVA